MTSSASSASPSSTSPHAYITLDRLPTDDISLRALFVSRASHLISAPAVSTYGELIEHRIRQRLPHFYDARISINAFNSSAHAKSSSPLHSSQQFSLAGLIDHTLLKPEAVWNEFRTLIDDAYLYGFYSVCVNGSRVAQCRAYIDSLRRSRGSPLSASSSSAGRPLLAAVCGFPLGASSPQVKAAECAALIAAGAEEIDLVLNIGALRDEDYPTVYKEIFDVCAVAHTQAVRVVVKVILEVCLLSPLQIIDGCILSVIAGADFVKTSTGFSSGGATIAAVKLMRQVVGAACSVKASGGIRDRQTALRMIDAGANRLGVSASVAIVKETQNDNDKQAKATSNDGQPKVLLRSAY